MIATANANPPFVFAQVARLTSDHLRLLSGVEALADRLSAGLSPEDATAELRGMIASARRMG